MAGKETDFLDQMMGSPAASEADESPAQPEAKGEPEQAEKPEPEAAPPAAAPEPKEEKVPLAAVMAEREKRQKYEKENEELRKQLEQAKAKPEPKELPEFFANPEGYVHAVVNSAEERARDRMYAALEEAEREAHTDFEEHFEAALAEAQKNPVLAKQILESKNPARAAYQLGKRMKATEALTADPAKYEADLRAKLRAEWEAEQANSKAATEAAEKEKALDAIPPDLAAEPSRSSRRAPKTNVFNELFPKPQ